MIIAMIKAWADKNNIEYYKTAGPLKEELVDAWIQEHNEQKPIVFEGSIVGNKRKITIFCAKCANVHKMFIEPGIRSHADRIIEAMCEGKYWNTEPYIYIDILPMSDKEKQLMAWDTTWLV